MSYKKILEALLEAGIPEKTIHLLDYYYVLPTARWIEKDLGKAMTNFLFYSGIKYIEDQFDCDNFAKTASTIADWSWAKTRKTEDALAFGVFGFATQLHMLNIAVHRKGTGLSVACYEPQPSGPNAVCLKPVSLSEEDFGSSTLCLFF